MTSMFATQDGRIPEANYGYTQVLSAEVEYKFYPFHSLFQRTYDETRPMKSKPIQTNKSICQ